MRTCSPKGVGEGKSRGRGHRESSSDHPTTSGMDRRSSHHMLALNWNCPQPPIEACTEPPPTGREEQIVTPEHLGARYTQQLLHPFGRKQLHANVQLLSSHRPARQRVGRVVFEDGDETTGSSDTVELSDKALLLGRRNMVKSADGHDHIEHGTIKREPRPVVRLKVSAGHVLPRRGEHRFRNINAVQSPHLTHEMTVCRACTAANIQEVFVAQIVSSLLLNPSEQVDFPSGEERCVAAGERD